MQGNSTTSWRPLGRVALILVVGAILVSSRATTAFAQGSGAKGEPIHKGWQGRGTALITSSTQPHDGGDHQGGASRRIVGGAMAFTFLHTDIANQQEVSIFMQQTRTDGRRNFQGLTSQGTGNKFAKFCTFDDTGSAKPYRYFGVPRGRSPGDTFVIAARLDSNSACELQNNCAGDDLRWECWFFGPGTPELEHRGGYHPSPDYVESFESFSDVMRFDNGLYSTDPSELDNIHIATFEHRYYFVDPADPPNFCMLPACFATGAWRDDLADYVPFWGLESWAPTEAEWPEMHEAGIKVFNHRTLHEPAAGDGDWDICTGTRHQPDTTPCGTCFARRLAHGFSRSTYHDDVCNEPFDPVNLWWDDEMDTVEQIFVDAGWGF